MYFMPLNTQFLLNRNSFSSISPHISLNIAASAVLYTLSNVSPISAMTKLKKIILMIKVFKNHRIQINTSSLVPKVVVSKSPVPILQDIRKARGYVWPEKGVSEVSFQPRM